MRNAVRTAVVVGFALIFAAHPTLALDLNPPAEFPPNGTPASEFLADLADLATTTDQAIMVATAAQDDNMCVADPSVFDSFEQAYVAMRSELSIAASALANGQSCAPMNGVAAGGRTTKSARLAYDPTCNTNTSIEINGNLRLADADLQCYGTLFIHVAPGAEVTVSVPTYDAASSCTPAIILTADNVAAFTVTNEGVEILHHFTTRGGVYRNAATNTWIRFL